MEKVNISLSDQEAGINGVGVFPAYRGKRYGRDILEFVIRKSQEMNATHVMLQVEAENSKALNLYTSCGFVKTSKMDCFILTKGEGKVIQNIGKSIERLNEFYF